MLSETGAVHRRGGTSLSYSSHLGLSRLLDKRDTRGLAGSVTSLDKLTLTSTARDSSPFITREMASNVQKLTPSCLSSPKQMISPTDTPLNSPSRSRSTSVERRPEAAAALLPRNPQDEGGLVASFFSSLKSALYGEQEREAKTIIKNKTAQQRKYGKGRHAAAKKFGILAKVEEVGVENLLMGYDSDSGDSLAGSGYYMSGSKTHRDLKSYTEAMDVSSCNEFEDIVPGSLTVMCTGGQQGPDNRLQEGWSSTDSTIGQLTAPFFSMFGRPSLNPNELGSVPVVSSPGGAAAAAGQSHMGTVISGRGPGRVGGPGQKRPMVNSYFGVPGVPGTGDLERSIRPDLGSVPSPASGLPQSQSWSSDYSGDSAEGGFIGSIGSLFFGRKGGLS